MLFGEEERGYENSKRAVAIFMMESPTALEAAATPFSQQRELSSHGSSGTRQWPLAWEEGREMGMEWLGYWVDIHRWYMHEQHTRHMC